MEDSTIDLSNDSDDENDQLPISQFKKGSDVTPPHEDHLRVLLKIFGHKEFRPLQWQIINSIINDRRDNCAIMATGYGKSLCYQFPSVYCGGVTIVISPLISLMEDQVLALTVSNIPACLLGTAQMQKKKVEEDILNNKYSLIYATPECVCSDYGKRLIKDMDDKLSITLIAIDEAHCISSWGHDFRHQYRELATFRNTFPHIPILAVTATATPQVRTDIISSLKLRNVQITYSGFDRPNLYFSVHLKGNRGIISDLHNVMIRQDGDWTFVGPTIIYCITKKNTEQVADLLKAQGIKCAVYHAGLPIKTRKETHAEFVRDKVNVIVATIAFGMGIDKPDVRNVIHYGASRDIESYYQEVGRAGRDGQPANCTIFYSSADFEILRSLREHGYSTDRVKKRKEVMVNLVLQYLETSNCRRQFILQHFEDTADLKPRPALNCCDNCTNKLKHKPEEYEEVNSDGLIDLTAYCHTLLTSIKIVGGNRGLQPYILFLRGSKSSRVPEKYQSHPLHGSGKHKSEEWWKCIARILERDKYLVKETVNKPTFSYCTVGISEKGHRFINAVEQHKNTREILIEPPPDLRALLKKKTVKELSIINTVPLPNRTVAKANNSTVNKIFEKNKCVESEAERDERMNIYRKLLARRTELSFSLDCMPYMIASNEVLMNLAQLKPTNMNQLTQCKLEGFTKAKMEKFGEDFVNVIRSICPTKQIKKSVMDALSENPLEDNLFTPTVETTYMFYCDGKSIDEIAKERNLARSTIATHLLKCMKLGYPIKLKYFNVSDQIKGTISKIIENLPAADSKFVTSIKNQCTPEISIEQILAVLTHVNIRSHLNKLGVCYEEFDNDSAEKDDGPNAMEKDFNTFNINESICESQSIEADVDDAALNALVDEIEGGGYLNETNVNSSEECTSPILKYTSDIVEPPLKKAKLKMSLLDSPPRKFI